MAQPLLESRTGAYLEWLVNELLVTANKNWIWGCTLVMLLVNAIKPQARKPCIILRVIFFSPDG
jgi:hypothetical protein